MICILQVPVEPEEESAAPASKKQRTESPGIIYQLYHSSSYILRWQGPKNNIVSSSIKKWMFENY